MSIAARVLVWIVGLYRRFISPLFPRHCRYEPTCSAYMVEAIKVHGAARGLAMGIRRIGRCHPWAPGGIDRVPAARARKVS